MHTKIKGNTSLGAWYSRTAEDNPNEIESHGDAGVIVYDCDTGMVNCHGGYTQKDKRNNTVIGIPPG
jgi:hypothetical protein